MGNDLRTSSGGFEILGLRAYWSLCLMLLALSIVGTTLVTRESGSGVDWLVPPAKQARSQAVVELSISDESSRHEPLALQDFWVPRIRGPVRLEVGPRGHLFVIDDGDSEAITELVPTGESLPFHPPPTKKPIRSVSDLLVTSDQIWIADLLGSTIHHFDRESGMWSFFDPGFEPYRLESNAGLTGRLAGNRVGAPFLIDVISPDRGIEDSFGSLIDDQESQALLLDGFLGASKRNIIFCGRYLGFLAAFSPEGELQWLVESIVPPDEPVLMKRGNTRWVEHSPLVASIALATSDDRVYVLSRRRDGLRVRPLIDVYSTVDGKYVVSLGLPPQERWTGLAVADGVLFVASESRIVQWSAALPTDVSLGGSTHVGRTTVRWAKPESDLQPASNPVSTGRLDPFYRRREKRPTAPGFDGRLGSPIQLKGRHTE